MTEMITPYNRALTMPSLTGAWDFGTVPGLSKVAKEIARQSMMIGYLNAFTMYTVTSGLAVVFVVMVRGRRAAGYDANRPALPPTSNQATEPGR